MTDNSKSHLYDYLIWELSDKKNFLPLKALLDEVMALEVNGELSAEKKLSQEASGVGISPSWQPVHISSSNSMCGYISKGWALLPRYPKGPQISKNIKILPFLSP